MRGLTILATGGALPSRTVPNADFEKIVDTSDEWIRSRTGIESRYFCGEGQDADTLAIEAGSAALERSGLGPEDIDCIIVATISGRFATPSVACMVQRALGLRENIPVLDVNAACSGFVYALETARGLLECTGGTYALIIGTEQLSKMLNMEDRTTCVLFGDGAGAALVKAEEGAFYAADLGARGGLAITAGGPGPEKSLIAMSGKEVFRFAAEALPASIGRLIEKTGAPLDAYRYVICHQANARIIDFVVKKLHASPDQFYMDMASHGNTSGASIPIALNELEETNRLAPGDHIILAGFGSGLTWAGAALTYAGPSA
ncbi:MAG: beta-ketoacyl-ACP synthase III [Lachnospiraceae bacterium]|nr:beta-ketoacyl-ACP synthase III [Lachnospiraceae bacterium]